MKNPQLIRQRLFTILALVKNAHETIFCEISTPHTVFLWIISLRAQNLSVPGHAFLGRLCVCAELAYLVSFICAEHEQYINFVLPF